MEIRKIEYQTIMLLSIMNEESQPIISKLSLKPDPLFINPFCECYVSQMNSLRLFLYKPKKDPKYQVDSVGSEIASLTAYIGIQSCQPDLLINLGSSGGVAKFNNNALNFKIGDVCVAKQAIGFFDREMIIKEFEKYQEGKYDIMSFENIHKKLKLKEVIVGTTSSFVSDCQIQKIQEVDIVEMEAAAIGKVCYWMKVPFYVLKVISDMDEPDQVKRALMFENQINSVSEILANKIYEFLQCLDAKDY